MDKLKRYIIIGAVFTAIAGILGHFVYEWTGKKFVVGLFFPVNESTWEHMKLIFFPMLIYSLFAGKKLKAEYPCIAKGFAIGILAGTMLIPVIFYTYSGILGFDVAWLNILTFIVSVILGFFVVYKVVTSCADTKDKHTVFLNIVVYIMLIAFMVFTYYPPNLGIFVNKV